MNLRQMMDENGKIIIPDYPLMFFLDLTQRCNLKCWFCYNEPSKERIDADFENIRKILNDMKQVGCEEVTYLGGEPTIYKYFWDTLEYANSLGYEQCFVTNGQVIDDGFAEKLSKFDGIEVGISFHSIKEDVQNAIAKSLQSYNRILRAIECLEKYNIRWYSQTSLVKDNYLEIGEMHNFLNRVGKPVRMDLSRMVEGEIDSPQFLDENEYKRVFEQINNLNLDALPVRVEAFPRCWLKKIAGEKHLNYDKIKYSVRPCYAWVGQVSIDIFGDVRMCPTGGAVAGNILKSGIKDLWKYSKEIKEFQEFSWQKEECRECSDFAFCVGACKMTCRGKYPAPDKYIIEGGMHYASNNE